jgi:cobalt-zinc-cadmium efflux system membrane fusion protein
MGKIIVPAVLLIGAALAAGAYVTRETWQPWLSKDVDSTAAKEDVHAHGGHERIKLSPQARANLRLAVKPIQLQTYWRTIQVPGVVVERRGKGDRSFVAPVTGVIQSIAALPGDIVQPGGELLTMRLTSEPLQTSQTELFKAAQEIRITQEQKHRLEKNPQFASEARILELQYQLERLSASRRAYRADLAIKGLTPKQIDQVEGGEFLKEIVVRVPTDLQGYKPPSSTADTAPIAAPLLEVEELKVQPGEQVQAGQLLGHLSNHQNLYIEGRGFREDTGLLEKTAAQGWPVVATFAEEHTGNWPPLDTPLTILYLANNIDVTSQTFPFYVPLGNQHREYRRDGKSYRIWRFRPGQRVQLGVPVQEYDQVFVVPAGAVVREGAEAYVFRQNGDAFDRKPVHVTYEDSRQVVIANDGSIFAGNFIAQNGAEALNRALKAQEESGGGHGHDHHDH